jgi:hypothetical protein
MGKKKNFSEPKTPDELEIIRKAGLDDYNSQVTNVILKTLSYEERQNLVNQYISDHTYVGRS